MPHTTPMLSTEQLGTRFAIPSRPAESAAAVDRRTPDRAEEGVDVKLDSNADAEAKFPGYSRVTNTGSIKTRFLVNEELVPIKIENIPGNYRLFNLVCIICF